MDIQHRTSAFGPLFSTLLLPKKTPLLKTFLDLIFISGFTGILSSFFAPIDYIQGENYRIIFLHVPCAWVSILLYGIITISSVCTLSLKHPFFDTISFYGARTGAFFTLLTLCSGSLWGKPMWGAFWVWDARLTSTMILFFIYLGYLQIRSPWTQRSKFSALAPASEMGAFFLCIGSLNIPIIKYSVSWWSTLHQPSSITQFGSSIHPSMLIPLDIIALFFCLLVVWIIYLEMRNERISFVSKTEQAKILVNNPEIVV